MYERATALNKSKKRKKTHPAAEASNRQGMGSHWQWGGSCGGVSRPPSNPLLLEKCSETESSGVSQWPEAQGGALRSETGKGKPKAEGGSGSSDPGIYALKKRDELALTNRTKGSIYSKNQQQRIIREARTLFFEGVPKSQALKALGASRSTYYAWVKGWEPCRKKASALSYAVYENQAIIDKKKTHTEMIHPKVSGSVRHYGFWIDPSSCSRVVKPSGWMAQENGQNCQITEN